MYTGFKHLHVLFVVISVVFFITRFVWKRRDSQLLQQRWVKIVPHVNDTLLLLSAIAMLIISQRMPVSDPWVTEKVIGVIGYILFGLVALKSATPAKSWAGFIIACFWLLALFHVAYGKQPLIFG
ncbi:SirB2 family protein [Idiomarina seosinensis]|uniref:SirB2 family protein n=1 Tax=Idiomarina seosinensis TaxID=281739 RepID=UPI00384AE97D